MEIYGTNIFHFFFNASVVKTVPIEFFSVYTVSPGIHLGSSTVFLGLSNDVKIMVWDLCSITI